MTKTKPGPSAEMEQIAQAVDVVLFDPQPLARVAAKGFLRGFDLETVLIAARGSAS